MKINSKKWILSACICVILCMIMQNGCKKVDQIDITGLWSVKIVLGGEQINGSFTITPDSIRFGSVSARYVFDGSRIDFTLHIDSYSYQFSGSVSSDFMTGSLIAGNGYYSFNGSWEAWK